MVLHAANIEAKVQGNELYSITENIQEITWLSGTEETAGILPSSTWKEYPHPFD
jgi:hypothetical protein